MIVPMCEVTVVVLRGERERALARLQDLALLDLAVPDEAATEDVEARRRELEAVKAAQVTLRPLASRGASRKASKKRSEETTPRAEALSPDEVVAEVAACLGRLNDQEAELRSWRTELVRIAPLGTFDPRTFGELERKGLALRLFVAPARVPVSAPPGSSLHELAQANGRRYLALVGRAPGPEELPGAEPFALPEISAEEIEKRIAELEDGRTEQRRRLAALAAALPELRRLELSREDRLRLEEARAAMGEREAFAYLVGFCPERDVARLEAEAEEHGWGLAVRRAQDPTKAPTFVEPPRWARSIGALFHVIGVLPAYDQMDVSVPVLAFFSLFFAIIVGDAGYGLLFLVLTLLERRFLHRAPKQVFRLLLLLSLATIAWGVATGNVFGVNTISLPLGVLRIGWLARPEHLIPLTFLIGAIQLSLAHGWNAIRMWGSLRAFAQIGWVLVIWTMFFLARTLVQGATFPHVLLPVFVVGLTLIVLFMTPWRQFGSQWFEHAMLPLSLVSAFVDVVSYVRLFAVGAASYAVAAAFDSMALSVGLKGPVAALLAALVLFLGHALNIGLASLGVLVHGVRLNTLEFAGHLGLEWSGRPYRPFAHPALEPRT